MSFGFAGFELEQFISFPNEYLRAYYVIKNIFLVFWFD